MDQHMIPRLLARRLGFIGKIPRITSHATRIARDDYTAIAIKAMPHHDSGFVIEARQALAFQIC
jgi:hypothetical protein